MIGTFVAVVVTVVVGVIIIVVAIVVVSAVVVVVSAFDGSDSVFAAAIAIRASSSGVCLLLYMPYAVATGVGDDTGRRFAAYCSSC